MSEASPAAQSDEAEQHQNQSAPQPASPSIQQTPSVMQQSPVQDSSSQSGTHRPWYAVQPQNPEVMQNAQVQQTTEFNSAERARWKAKLTKYFALRSPEKTETDVENCLKHYETKGLGYEKMWAQATKKFGTEQGEKPTDPPNERQTWKTRLTAYYTLVDPSKTERDVDECLKHFAQRPGGFALMWKQVQKKYGVQTEIPGSPKRWYNKRGGSTSPKRPGQVYGSPNVADEEFETSVRDVLSSRQRAPQAQRLSSVPRSETNMFPQLEPRIMIIVIIGGVSMKLYRAAGPANQFRFNSAVAAEIKELVNLPETVTVTRVSDCVDGATIEMETRLSAGWSSAHVGSDLIRRVMSGDCSVSSVRAAYVDFLQGNPQRLFVMDAAVVEYRASPGFRANLLVANRNVTSMRTAYRISPPRDQEVPVIDYAPSDTSAMSDALSSYVVRSFSPTATASKAHERRLTAFAQGRQ